MEETREDEELLGRVDRSMAEAEAAAGSCLDYRRGCPACCIGPFPITGLDADRLARGLAELEASEPARAAVVRRRASEAVAALLADYPGDPATGQLDEDEEAEERFCARFAELPCPALDPASGRCDLYAFRPLSCRTYGPPVRVGGQDLPPCERCFRGSSEEADRSRRAVDPEGLEAAILARMGGPRETLVAFALARGARAAQ